ncbi:MAG: MFS transporter [Desulfobacca sp.]|nr:MFS transporter [Desulfobacca sp.]
MNQKTRGILAVTGSSLAIFWSGAFIFGLPGVLSPVWQKMFQVGKGPIGNTLFFVLAAVGLFMFFVGRWQERFGIRKMITFGVLLCGLNPFLLGQASSLSLLYLWAFLNGLASCFIYIPALTTVQRWFPEKRGLMSGIVNLSFGVSGGLMAPLFGYLLQTLGYVSMNSVLAFMALFVGLVAAQFTEMPGSQASQVSGPGMKPGPAVIDHSLSVRQSLRTGSFWFLWLTWALQGAAGIAMVTLSVNFGLAKGLTQAWAIVILMAFNLTNGISRIVMGYLSDKVGRAGAMSFTFFSAGCAYLVLPYMSSFPAIILLASVIGFAFGTLFAVSAPLATDCFGLKHFGAIFGLVFTAYGFIAGVLGPSLSGYILDGTKGNFFIVFTYLGIFCLLSGLLILRVVPPKRP